MALLARQRRGWDAWRLFERFTEEARAVLAAADGEARLLHHRHVGDGHILLGLLQQEGAPAAGVLSALGIEIDRCRARLLEIVPAEDDRAPPRGQIPFTPRAKKVLELALREALNLGTNHIGTEILLLALARENQALLLGLLRVEDGLAARVLASFDVTLERARAEVLRRVSAGEDVAPEQIPFTPRAKQALERAWQEARGMGHNYVGTEHVLLAIAEAGEGIAVEVLGEFGLDSQKIREEIMRLSNRSPTRRRRAGRGEALAFGVKRSVLEQGFEVKPRDDVLRLRMSAAARALEDGRTEMTIADLLIALSRGHQTGPLLAELGLGEAAIRAAFEGQGTSEQPPEAAAGADRKPAGAG